MKFLELQIYNSENYKYEIMRIPIMVYESRIKGQGTTGAQLRIFCCVAKLCRESRPFLAQFYVANHAVLVTHFNPTKSGG